MYRLLIRTALALSALLGMILATPALAQDQDFTVELQPQAGPPGTTVTITGRGAPAGALVRILYAPFEDLAQCRASRGADLIAEVRADQAGRFLATHLARRSADRQAGHTYFADLGGEAGQPMSNLTCFTFAQQQGDGRFFPETGHSVGGRFLEFWQRNGGLPVFGYPLTAERQEDGRTVQYFERARFELHPENQPPYDVLLGRLGVRMLEQRGVDWMGGPASPGPAPGCQYFPETRHNVCNQQAGLGFLNYWRTHGLEFDGRPGKSYAESLALFGYPVTEPYQETGEDGQTYQVQWFERARFEWHPDNPQQYRVLLGRLGAQLLEAQGGQPPEGPPLFSEVQIALIALGDAGQSGERIGCDDSVVLVPVSIEPTAAPLTAALEQLFAIDSEYYGESGLYNVLHRSDLRLERAVVAQGRATIELAGELRLGGVCDSPRVEAQIQATARQFSTVNEVVVTLNGQPLEEVLSAR
jgi:hypothetical protein